MDCTTGKCIGIAVKTLESLVFTGFVALLNVVLTIRERDVLRIVGINSRICNKKALKGVGVCMKRAIYPY